MPAAPANSEKLTVLVLGANGFVGGYIVSALRAAGHTVKRAVRPREPLAADEVACDLSRLGDAASCQPLLDGVDAVVNAAGILRETRHDSFHSVHVAAPSALAQACHSRGIARLVQISVLGDPADGEFIASKHRGDEALLATLPSALVLRPSVVFSATGSYGGTSLLRALSAVPLCMPLPGAGDWRIQPLPAEDLANLVLAGLQRGCQGLYEVAGPAPMTWRDYQWQWRAWLRVPGRRSLSIPARIISMLAWLGERVGQGPMGATMWRMLQRGNVAAPDAHARLQQDFGLALRDLGTALAAHPSQVQDRWQAQLYLLATPLKLATVAVWLCSAVTGWRTEASEIDALTAGSLLAWLSPVLLVRATAWLDALLALWLLMTPRPRTPLLLMGLSVLAYTVILGSAVPGLWWDPLGGLVKNLMLLPALAILWVLSERR